jgi:toxin HigB-1
LEILFQTNKLKKDFSNMSSLTRAYGPERADLIQKRLTQLILVVSLAEIRSLPAVRCHELTGDRKGQLALDLKHPYRLIIEPANDPLPLKPDGGLDWAGVTVVRIIEVVDYHG